jgi:hypothetical protein
MMQIRFGSKLGRQTDMLGRSKAAIVGEVGILLRHCQRSHGLDNNMLSSTGFFAFCTAAHGFAEFHRIAWIFLRSGNMQVCDYL